LLLKWFEALRWNFIGQLDIVHQGIGQRPGAGHIRDVIAAAAEGDPGKAERLDALEDLAESVGGQSEVSQRISDERIHAQLRYQGVRFERFDQRQHDLIERPQVRFVIRARVERDIDGVPQTRSPADLLDKSRAGKKKLPIFVQRDGHHLIRVVKPGLDAVSMMDVYVQMGELCEKHLGVPDQASKYYQQATAGTNLVLLEPDVARAFPDSNSVNRALRLLHEVATSSSTRSRKSASGRRKATG